MVPDAGLHHILPRPDGVNRDGIRHFDPATGRGVVCRFKPSPVADAITIKLRGVEPGRRHRVSSDDGTNPAAEKTGGELARGDEVALKDAPVSE